MRQFLFGALCLSIVAVDAFADATPCSARDFTSTPLTADLTDAGHDPLPFDTLVAKWIASSDVAQSKQCSIDNQSTRCLLVPKYHWSSTCDPPDPVSTPPDQRHGLHYTICGLSFDDAGINDHYCLVTDEFSQLGLALAMASTKLEMPGFPAPAPYAFRQWTNTVRLLNAASSETKGLPVWVAKVDTANATNPITKASDDDASDATARIMLALYIAAHSKVFSATDRREYEGLANQLADAFIHYDFKDTRFRYTGAGRYWPAGGKGAAQAEPEDDDNPFSWTGYYGDIALALLAAHRTTGEQRYVDRARDAVANYLAAAAFTASFRVPPTKFVWNIGNVPPAAVASQDLSGHWDDADAPRAVSLCKAAYLAGVAGISIEPVPAIGPTLAGYCAAWMGSPGVTNNGIPYARQYNLNGSVFGSAGTGYLNVGLGATLNFLRCPNDLQLRLQSAASEFDADSGLFANETCFGVYDHAFFVVNYGSGLARDRNAFKPVLSEPTNLQVARNGANIDVSWTGTGAPMYEIARGCNDETFSIVRTQSPASWTDTSVPATSAAFYKVRAVNADSEVSRFTPSRSVSASTPPQIVPRSTPILASHITDLRAAANQFRLLAGVGAFSFAEAIQPGVTTIKGSHFTELRDAIDEARRSLGLGNYPWHTVISGADRVIGTVIDELHDALRGCTAQTEYRRIKG